VECAENGVDRGEAEEARDPFAAEKNSEKSLKILTYLVWAVGPWALNHLR
jgi:hypothetical protein